MKVCEAEAEPSPSVVQDKKKTRTPKALALQPLDGPIVRLELRRQLLISSVA